MTTPKILVAEDDQAFRHEVGVFLRQNGFEVVCVEDGYQAVEFALREEPDLLLLDVHMPAGDGFSVHERLQRHPHLALCPVIYMTHDPSERIEQIAAADGAYTLFHKPFALDDLVDAVIHALNRDSGAARSDAA